MKLHREGLAAQTSPEVRLKERGSSAHLAKHEGHATLLAVLGAPLRRGVQGASAWMRQSEKLKESPWFDVFKKVILGAGALALIAYLGHRAERDERHGPVLFAEPERGQELVGLTPPLLTAPVQSKAEKLAGTTNSEASSLTTSITPCQKVALAGPVGVTKDGLVILNEATADEMTQLPSVGPARARAIIELRERLGRFKKISDLLRIKGIGWKTLQKMKDKAVLDRPVETPAVERAPAPVLAPAPAGNSLAEGAPRESRMARADVKAEE